MASSQKEKEVQRIIFVGDEDAMTIFLHEMSRKQINIFKVLKFS